MRTAPIVLTACAALAVAAPPATAAAAENAAVSGASPSPSRVPAAASGATPSPSPSPVPAAASGATPPPSHLAATASGTTPAPPGLAAAASGAASCSRAGRPLFGVARAGGGRVLARIGRRTLLPRSSPRIPLPAGVFGWSWAPSPSCDAVALGGDRGRVLLADLERGRRMRSLSLGGRAAVGQVAWPRADRLTGLTGSFRAMRAVTVSVPDGRVVASRPVGGRAWVIEPTSLGLAVLAGPGERIGSATLVLASPDGQLLRAPLPRIRVGFQLAPRRLLGRELIPGVAVDEAGGRAYVIAATEPLVAEVNLADGAVTYHELRGGAGAAGPVAVAAKGIANGAYRTARWVGDGTIAVSGEVTRTRPDSRRAARRGLTVTRTDPYGLRLIRTADWTATTLNPLLRSFTLTGGLLLGMNAEPASLAGRRPTGLVAYGPDGRRRFTRFRDRGRAWLREVAWPYAYVREISPRRTLVVDVRTGRTVGETGSRRPPVLLVR
jgi:hypothetical protein